jgi:hypothetical protein
VQWDVTNLVDDWYSGRAANHGLLLLSHPDNELHFHSRESSTEEARPQLEIDLVPVDDAKTPQDPRVR